MSEIKQNITNELSEEELENIAGGFGRPTMDDPRYKEQMRINTMLKRGVNYPSPKGNGLVTAQS